jgi:hypothetical protein
MAQCAHAGPGGLARLAIAPTPPSVAIEPVRVGFVTSIEAFRDVVPDVGESLPLGTSDARDAWVATLAFDADAVRGSRPAVAMLTLPWAAQPSGSGSALEVAIHEAVTPLASATWTAPPEVLPTPLATCRFERGTGVSTCDLTGAVAALLERGRSRWDWVLVPVEVDGPVRFSFRSRGATPGGAAVQQGPRIELLYGSDGG